jgi:hypothetical protein
MTVDYTDICPCDEHDHFNDCVQKIIDTMQSNRYSSKAPTKVIRDLEQLKRQLARLSREASAEIYWAAEIATIDDCPIAQLQKNVDAAIEGVRSGRSVDCARIGLGLRAADLWIIHGGDIDKPEFVSFLEALIEDAGFGGEGKVKIDAGKLVKELMAPPWYKGRSAKPPEI